MMCEWWEKVGVEKVGNKRSEEIDEVLKEG